MIVGDGEESASHAASDQRGVAAVPVRIGSGEEVGRFDAKDLLFTAKVPRGFNGPVDRVLKCGDSVPDDSAR
jgi:hypothetical protein